MSMQSRDDITAIFGPALKPLDKPSEESVGGVVPSSASEGVSPDEVNTVPMLGLAAFVMKHFRINYDERQCNGVNERLKYALSAQTCSYDERQKAMLRSLGISERIYSPVTAIKVRAAKAMLNELSAYGNECPFEIEPTPDPEVPQEVAQETYMKIQGELNQVFQALEQSGVQELPPEAMLTLQKMVSQAAEVGYDEAENAKEAFAKKRARRMRKKVWDIMVEGGWNKAAAECLDYACTYGTAVMAGPIMRNRVHNKSVKDKKTGVRKLQRVIDSVPCFEALNPVDCYPSPDAKEVSDGVFCVRVKYTREELWKFKRSSAAKGEKKEGEEGWRDNAITMLLEKYPEFGCRLNEFVRDQEIRKNELNGTDSFEDCKFEGVRCFAYVEGRFLRELGITKSLDGMAIEATEFYYTETIVMDGTVVFCRIYDERMGCPLSKTVFYELPGSWWGECIADKLYSVQATMNNAIISLLRNMGPASAGMMWINDVSRLVDKSPNGLAAVPGKIYAFQSSYSAQTAAGSPMGVIQLPSNAAELLSVANWSTKQADLDSGIPALSEGTGGSNGGALRTAAGLRTYTEAASRGMKMIINTNDRYLITDVAKRVADWILISDDDMELKGDVEVRSIGMMGRILKAENDQSRIQLFNLCLNNQMMQQILGVKGIIELFRPSCKDIGINPDNVCPDTERLAMLEQIEQLKQLYAATNAQMGVEANAAKVAASGAPQGEGGGTDQGVEPVAQPGGVAERRAVA